MSESLAGIAIFPVGGEYNVSVTLVASSDGSMIGTKSAPSPSSLTSLAETVTSIFAGFPETTVSEYYASVPPAFPADKYYEVFKALSKVQVTEEFPSLLLNHGEAWSATLPKDTTTSALLLDFSTPAHLYAGSFNSVEKAGKRVNTPTQELSVSFDEDKSFTEALKKIQASDESNKIPDQVVAIKPTSQLDEPVDIDALLAGIFPNIPISTTDSEGISKVAASLLYAKSQLPVRHIRAQYALPLPVSVATATGAVVPLAPPTYRIPAYEFITLTNSVDNQKSATVRLLLGNHAQAKDNLQRAVAVLEDLKPLPKGEARIKVSINVEVLDGWREAAEIVVEQQDGPKKTFLFPRFMADLPADYEKYEIRAKKEEGFVQQSDKVVGELPSK